MYKVQQKSLKHWSHCCKEKRYTQCQYIRYHMWIEHTRGKWMRGYGTKLVWNSVRSTFRAPSNLRDAVMLQETKTHKYNYNDKGQLQPHLIKIGSGKKLMPRTTQNLKMQPGFTWIIKRHEILSMFWHGTLRNNVHCSNHIMHCKMVVTLQGTIMAIELRNLMPGHDNHADCTTAVHIHWHI
jgi:hypothetical protein